MKKTILAASIAAVLGASVISPASVSTALATSANQGSAAESILSATHDGITLKVSDLTYNGTRLSFLLIRDGIDLPTTASPYIDGAIKADDNEWVRERKVPEKDRIKGYITNPTLLVNGKKIDGMGSYGDYPVKKHAFRVDLTNVSNLPDDFELTIQTKVTKVKETFELKIPVKATQKPLILKPNASKSDGEFSYTVKELHVSPVSTRLILDSNGPVPRSSEQTGEYIASKVYYELVDDKGNALEQEIFGYFHKEPGTKDSVNELYKSANGTSKSITIKPFTLTVNPKDWSVKGQGKKSVGDKTYLKDLEVTIPVAK
ncbi:DUF5643 domain-containing protein [Paenibacillus sp. 481]|uniref:DUF5643 domain-containing protein n=1 Tax=Paenibacillus sp. 481 TaxID=2835869 RepID=UPI001E566EF9|nr:DUF5643 domain-containing protein [Paenibacillus sp. 481]